MTRQALPQRRRNVTVDAEHNGRPIALTIGYDAEGAPREVFAGGPRVGSETQHLLSDACVVISIALQWGIPPADLARSLGTVPAWVNGQEGEAPASLIGTILRSVIAEGGA